MHLLERIYSIRDGSTASLGTHLFAIRVTDLINHLGDKNFESAELFYIQVLCSINCDICLGLYPLRYLQIFLHSMRIYLFLPFPNIFPPKANINDPCFHPRKMFSKTFSLRKLVYRHNEYGYAPPHTPLPWGKSRFQRQSWKLCWADHKISAENNSYIILQHHQEVR